MAEVTGLRNNALPYPVYGCAYGVSFPLLDADGDPISPSSPDSEVSKNGDTFADCTNEATEIATSSGICYLLLTASEMTADVVTVRVQSTGAKTTVLTLYPRKLPILSTGTCQGANDTGDIQLASGDSAVDDYYNGCLVVAVIDSTTEARIINDYVGSTKVAEVSPAWNTAAPDNNDTYTIYLPEGRQVLPVNLTHISGAAVSASTAQLGVNVVNFGGSAGAFASGRPEVNTSHIAGSAVSTSSAQIGVNVVNAGGTAWGSGAITANSIASDAITAAKIATGAIDADAIADNAIDAGAIANDAITAAKIANGAIDAATFAADVDAEILSYIVDDATRIDASALNTASVTTIPAILDDTDLIDDGTSGLAKIATDVAAILVDTGTTLQAELDGIQADTEDIQARLPAALTADGNIKADALKIEGADPTDTINAQADLALSDYDPPTRTEATADKNEILAYLNGLVIAKGTIGSTGNSTTQLHLTGLTYGDDEINNYLIAIKDVSAGEWHARYIEDWADTGDLVTVATLPFTPENAVDAYAILAFRQDVTGGAGLDAAGVRAAVGLASANLDTQLGTIDTNVDAIQAKTDNLPSDPAEASVVAGLIGGLDTKLDTIDNFLDTEIAGLITSITGIVPISGTIGATGNDTTHLHLSGLAYADDGINSMLLTIKDVSTGLFYSRWIEDFANTGDLATVATLPFTPEASVDLYWLTPVRSDVTGGSGLDAAGVRAAIGLASANLDTQLGTIDTEVGVIDGIVDTIVADTNELQTDWANGGRLDNILDARASQTSVDDLPTNAELATALGTADDAVLAQIALVKAVTDKVDDTLEDDGGTYRFTANALEEAPTGGTAPTAGEIADAVWDEATAGHTTSGTFGEQVKTDVDAILADTNELQTDWVNGGRLDNILDARASQTSVDDLPTNAELATALAGADDAVLAAIAALNNLSQANIRTAVGLASANLDTQLGDLPTNAELATALGTADDAVLAAVAALNNLSSAQAQTAAAAALAAYDPPTRTEATADKDEVIVQINANETKIDTLDTVADAIKLVTDKLDDTVEDDAGTYRFTTNALEQAPTGAGDLGDTATQVEEMHKVMGLDAANPVTHTRTSTTVDDIEIERSGNGSTTTTLTRQ